MVDSLQRTSIQPLALHQTEAATRNPFPLNSPADHEELEATVRQAVSDSSIERFRDYLDQSSIMTLEKAQRESVFDPVAEIAGNSVYLAREGGFPL